MLRVASPLHRPTDVLRLEFGFHAFPELVGCGVVDGMTDHLLHVCPQAFAELRLLRTLEIHRFDDVLRIDVVGNGKHQHNPARLGSRSRSGSDHVFGKLGMDAVRNLGCRLLVVALPNQLLKIAPQCRTETVFRDSGNFSFFDSRRSLARCNRAGNQQARIVVQSLVISCVAFSTSEAAVKLMIHLR